MDIGIVDVGEWQTALDMKTGRQGEVPSELMKTFGPVIARHPYPGDLDGGGTRWVTETALDVCGVYEPDFIMLDYSDIFFAGVFRAVEARELSAMRDLVFSEIKRFLGETGFDAFILGLGNLRPIEGTIPVLGLDGWAEAVGMTPHFAGLFEPSERDLARFERDDNVERLVTGADLKAEFGGCEAFYDRCPDVLAYAREGWIFRGFGSASRPVYMMPARDRTLPLFMPEGAGVESITDIAGAVLNNLKRRKTALILVEATGTEDFPLPAGEIDSTMGWHSYAHGEGHYQTITTGEHFVERPYPPAYRAYLDDNEKKPYPLSGFFEEINPKTIGRRYAGRSAAVGQRSILTHVAAGTDITIECFARALYNHGIMAMINSEKLSPDVTSGRLEDFC